jgi:hypothetical protein
MKKNELNEDLFPWLFTFGAKRHAAWNLEHLLSDDPKYNDWRKNRNYSFSDPEAISLYLKETEPELSLYDIANKLLSLQENEGFTKEQVNHIVECIKIVQEPEENDVAIHLDPTEVNKIKSMETVILNRFFVFFRSYFFRFWFSLFSCS